MSKERLDSVLSSGWHGVRTPRAGVIGLGLIGGSWAGALARLGWDVSAVDCDKTSLEAAQAIGWISQGWLEVPDVLDVDLVILALPISLIAETLPKIADRVPPETVVTDVGSIKSEICELADRFSTIHFIGGHPMAGSEKRGFSAAHPDLFRGYPYVLTPSAQCPPEVIGAFADLVTRVGAQVIFRGHEEHDRQVALVSHVPHLLALALAVSAYDGFTEGNTFDGFPKGSPLDVAGRSFRDLTRLVESSSAMWQEIFLRNAPAVLSSLEVWEGKIREIRDLIERLDGEGIEKVFQKAQQARKHVLNRRVSNELQESGLQKSGNLHRTCPSNPRGNSGPGRQIHLPSGCFIRRNGEG